MNIKAARIADGFPGERLTILPEAVVRRARVLPVCRDLCVTHTGRFDRVRGHFVDRPHGRPEYVLIVCLAGKGRVKLETHEHHLSRGHGIVLPPQRAHAYVADTSDPWSLFWFHFTGRKAADYAAALELDPVHPRFWVQDIEQLADAFEECFSYVLGGYTNADLLGLSTAFSRLLGRCRTFRRSANLRLRRTENRVLHTLQFMRENLHRTLTLKEIAHHASLSVPHFGAMFRRQLNCPPLGMHIRLRMQRACELLAGTDHNIGEIGNALGYADPLYFSRMFRQKTGESPSQYRRTQVSPRM
ncbi:MAG: AraC family transcriptional regulator [Undibacterium sp.]|nr:AraC family transcriptional regulator [Opitutaceae bacterium]